MSTQAIATTTPEALLALVVDLKKVEEFKAASSPMLRAARDFTIEDQTDYDFSLTIAEEAIKRRKVKEEWMRPAKKLADLMHSLLCTMERQMIADDVEIETIIKQRRKDFRAAQERIRQAEEDEKRRLAHEAQQAAALAEAAQLEKEGEKEAAEVVIERALSAPAPAIVIQSSVPKQTGSAVTKKWGYRIDDKEKVQREFCDPSSQKIKQRVDAYGMNAGINGVTVFPDENEAIRTKGR